MSDNPRSVGSKDDLELRHHIVYYTFLPVLVGFGATILSSPVLWYLGHVSYSTALALPWLALLGICLYIGTLGDYVIPSQTYRKVRSGQWGGSDGE